MRKPIAAFVLGFVLAVSVPVLADHVNEPTLPLTGLRTLVYQYPNAAAALACDGTDKITFSNLRVEPLITFQRDGAGGASEHWTVRISVLPGRVVNSEFRAQKAKGGSDTIWHHQNVEPHFPFGEYETTQWNTYMAVTGYWQVAVQITGKESGNVFETNCVFEKTS